MPKMKTNRSVAKRLRRSGTGKIIRNKQGARHMMSSKNSKRRRHLRKSTTIAKSMESRFKALVPYLSKT